MKLIERLIWIFLCLALSASLVFSWIWNSSLERQAGRGDLTNFIDRLNLMDSINNKDWAAAKQQNENWLRWELYAFNNMKELPDWVVYRMHDNDYEFLMNRIKGQFPELLDTIDEPP